MGHPSQTSASAPHRPRRYTRPERHLATEERPHPQNDALRVERHGAMRCCSRQLLPVAALQAEAEEVTVEQPLHRQKEERAVSDRWQEQ